MRGDAIDRREAGLKALSLPVNVPARPRHFSLADQIV
jgi:hypothetical protein